MRNYTALALLLTALGCGEPDPQPAPAERPAPEAPAVKPARRMPDCFPPNAPLPENDAKLRGQE